VFLASEWESIALFTAKRKILKARSAEIDWQIKGQEMGLRIAGN